MGSERIKLKNNLPHTAEWVYFDDQGSFVAEFYDYSEDARETFGRDIAYQVKVHSPDLETLLRHLQGEGAVEPDKQERILQLMEEKFGSYFLIKKWLEEEQIPYEKIFIDWA